MKNIIVDTVPTRMPNASRKEVIVKCGRLLLRQLQTSILPFWTSPALLGNPIGNFPTYVSQIGVPDLNQPHYTRMHGRQTYVYLASYFLLHDPQLLEWGLKGLEFLERLRNPNGGYCSTSTIDGRHLDTPITIQDQCYSVFPYVMAYRVTQNKAYLNRLWQFVDFIDRGPYLQADGTYWDSLKPDMVTKAPFKTNSMNIVSVIDFLNAVLIPTLMVTPESEITDERKMLLVKWCDLLVADFYAKGIFWNDKLNRTDWRALHVDLGHTSKSYGILFKANRLLEKWGQPKNKYFEIMANYPSIVKAAADDRVGWWTDFDGSATKFAHLELSWWRHILVDQTVLLYSSHYPELVELLTQGVEAWLRLPFGDRKREVGGVRELLTAQGQPVTDEDNAFCKANLWKNGYHEVEHVVSFFE